MRALVLAIQNGPIFSNATSCTTHKPCRLPVTITTWVMTGMANRATRSSLESQSPRPLYSSAKNSQKTGMIAANGTRRLNQNAACGSVLTSMAPISVNASRLSASTICAYERAPITCGCRQAYQARKPVRMQVNRMEEK